MLLTQYTEGTAHQHLSPTEEVESKRHARGQGRNADGTCEEDKHAANVEESTITVAHQRNEDIKENQEQCKENCLPPCTKLKTNAEGAHLLSKVQGKRHRLDTSAAKNSQMLVPTAAKSACDAATTFETFNGAKAAEFLENRWVIGTANVSDKKCSQLHLNQPQMASSNMLVGESSFENPARRSFPMCSTVEAVRTCPIRSGCSPSLESGAPYTDFWCNLVRAVECFQEKKENYKKHGTTTDTT